MPQCRTVRGFLDWSWKACFSAPTVHVGVDSLLFCVLGDLGLAARFSPSPCACRHCAVTPFQSSSGRMLECNAPSSFVTVDCCAWCSMMGSAQPGKARLT